jgi:hypothetical protein
MSHDLPLDPDVVRLRHLLEVAAAEERNLLATGERLFRTGTVHDIAKAADDDPVIAERIEAFVARFSRLQDTLGDKILPLTLRMAGEDVLPMIGNLDRAERYAWLDSADGWLRVRKLRNRMVHEYVNDPADLAAALGDIHAAVPSLSRCLANLKRFAESRLL